MGEVTYVEHLMDAEGKSRVSARDEHPVRKLEFSFTVIFVGDRTCRDLERDL